MNSTQSATPRFPIISVPSILLLASILCTGCVSHNVQPPGVIQSPPFDFAPKQLAQEIKRIVSSPPISLAVEDEQPGQIVTTWQPFRGEFHIARYWYERTRYHISVIPDFNDPSRRSRIQVADETQQRPDESGLNEKAKNWSPAPDLHRPDRSQALLQQIEMQLGNDRR